MNQSLCWAFAMVANDLTLFQPEQFEKVVFPTRKLPGYAPGCGTSRLMEVAMIALQKYTPVYNRHAVARFLTGT